METKDKIVSFLENNLNKVHKYTQVEKYGDEAAKLNAEADVIRAKGIAEANKIIGGSLQGNECYLEWLWIDNIEKNPNAVFYIPTENKIPIFNFAKPTTK